MFFMTFFTREINPVYYFYLKMNMLIILNKFFYYLLLQLFRCRIKQKSI